MRVFVVFVALFFSSCQKIIDSEVMEEGAEVIQLAYIPETIGYSDPTCAVGSDGGIAVAPAQEVRMPEVWAVVFRCERHKMTFALRGKGIYDRAKVGQRVTLRYVDKLLVRSDGSQEVVDHETKKVIFP